MKKSCENCAHRFFCGNFEHVRVAVKRALRAGRTLSQVHQLFGEHCRNYQEKPQAGGEREE